MSGIDDNGRATGQGKNGGVLVNLPRTRPQRSSPRRMAARKRAALREPATTRAPTRKRSPGAARPPRGPARRYDAAPRQGFESENENMSGSVQPPGSAEFIASAAEAVSELAKAGLSTGERLLKDVLSRLPHS